LDWVGWGKTCLAFGYWLFAFGYWLFAFGDLSISWYLPADAASGASLPGAVQAGDAQKKVALSAFRV
jgi:hypothetical protein